MDLTTIPAADPLTALGVFGVSFALGLVKKHTAILDGKVGDALKPVQPLIVAVAGLGLPYLTAALGIAPVDPAALVTAPAATVLAVSAREILSRVRGS